MERIKQVPKGFNRPLIVNKTWQTGEPVWQIILENLLGLTPKLFKPAFKSL